MMNLVMSEYTQTLPGGDINHKLIYNIMILQHT